MAGLGKRKHTDEERRKRLAEDEARRQRNIKAQPVTLPTRVARAVNKVILPVAKETDRLIGQPAKKALDSIGKVGAPLFKDASAGASRSLLDGLQTKTRPGGDRAGMQELADYATRTRGTSLGNRIMQSPGGLDTSPKLTDFQNPAWGALSLGAKPFQKILLQGSARVGGTLALTNAQNAKGREFNIPATPFTKSVFGDGVAGEEPGQVTGFNRLRKNIAEGSGLAGGLSKLTNKAGVPSVISAPVIAGLSLGFDANPFVGGLDDVAKASAKAVGLLDKAGTLKNVVTKAGQTVNQADMLKVLGKARVIDETSTIVRTKTGALKLMTNKRAAQYVAKQEGADVLDSVSNVGRTLGFNNASEYASEAKAFNKTNKVSATDSNMRFNAGFDGKRTAAATTKPFEPLGIAEEIATREAKIADPYQAAATIGEIRTKEDLLDAVAASSQLRKLGTPEAADAARQIMSKLGDSKIGTEAAQTLRIMQEFYARQPNSMVDDYLSMIRDANKDLAARGKKLIPENPETVAKIKAIEEQLKEVPVGSLQAKALMSEAQNLAKANLPMGLGKWASAWFRSSILSSPATAMINMIGTVAPTPVELVSRGIQRTVGNAATNAIFGVKSAGDYNVSRSAQAGWDGFKAVLRDFAKGTNSFGEFTDMATGGKNFNAAKTFGQGLATGDVASLARNGGDVMERISRLFTSVTDAPVKEAFFFSRMDEIARLATKAGEDISNPKVMQEIAERATIETELRFFINNGWLRQGFTGLAKGIGNIGRGTEWNAFFKFMSDSLIPFTTIPPNLVARGLVDYTPLGLIKTGGTLINLLRKRKTLTKMQRLALAREFSQAASRATAGTAISSAVAYLGSELGIMTFGRDSRDKIADVQSAQRIPMLGINMEAAGRVFGVLIEATIAGRYDTAWEETKAAGKMRSDDSWISYEALQPLAIGVATIGNMIESGKNSPDQGFFARLPGGLDAGAKGVLGNPIFQNFRTFGTASQNPTESFASIGGNIVTGTITPGMLSFIAQLTDREGKKGVVRETYAGDIFESIGARIKSRVPGLRQDLPQAVDLGGNKVYNDNVLLSSLGRSTAPQTVNLPKTVQAGINLSDITGAERAIPTRVDKKGTQFGIDYALSPRELVWAREVYGKATQSELDRLLKDPEFLAKTPVQQESAISGAYSDIHSTIKAYFAMEALGVASESSQVPWYAWKGMVDGMREYKTADGRVLFDTLTPEQKRKAIAANIKTLIASR